MSQSDTASLGQIRAGEMVKMTPQGNNDREIGVRDSQT
jgi:hypothetical protein